MKQLNFTFTIIIIIIVSRGRKRWVGPLGGKEKKKKFANRSTIETKFFSFSLWSGVIWSNQKIRISIFFWYGSFKLIFIIEWMGIFLLCVCMMFQPSRPERLLDSSTIELFTRLSCSTSNKGINFNVIGVLTMLRVISTFKITAT